MARVRRGQVIGSALALSAVGTVLRAGGAMGLHHYRVWLADGNWCLVFDTSGKSHPFVQPGLRVRA